jgi:hypothetical protein
MGMGRMNTTAQTEKYERALIQIVRRLPPERASEVLDFAHFLEFQAGKTGEGEAYTEDDARWDALLATEESQRLLEKMADEALSEIEAGQARPTSVKNGGELGSRLPQRA